MKLNPDEYIVRYSRGKGKNLAVAKNLSKAWPEFKKDFREALPSGETFAQYQKLTRDEQSDLKGRNGWFYRAQIEGGKRNATAAKDCDIVTLDFDYATPEFLDMMEAGLVAPGIAYFATTTRSATEEHPRMRIIVLLDSAVSNDMYPAVSRILCRDYFDPTMTLVDKVSFRKGQMMYMPTRSKDQRYFFYENVGKSVEPVPVSEMLDAFEETTGDWRVISVLPRCEGEEVRETSEKAEDPWTKPGIVGNFCRAYPNIMDAYDKYLPGIYEPTDTNSERPRYTYTPGSSTDGAVVYDDGRFMLSNHGTDPTADMLVNAFDGVRIHLFGELDQGIDTGTKMSDRPSWKAMLDHIKEDKLYRVEQAKERYDREAMFDDIMNADDIQWEEDEEDLVGDIPEGQREPDVEEDEDDLVGDPNKRKAPPEPGPAKKRKKSKWQAPDPDWISNLDFSIAGKIDNNLSNLGKILQYDPRTGQSLEYNEFLSEVVTRFPLQTKLPEIPRIPIRDQASGDILQDSHANAIRMLLESPNGKGKHGWGLKVSDRDLHAGLEMAAMHYPFHPVQEMLESGEWDGVPRARTMFVDYLGCPDHIYYKETCINFLVAAVARVYEPGHKFDFVPVLEGVQGKRKSTFIKIIAMKWFEELKGSFSDEKRLVEQMMGAWILELPELSAVTRSMIEEIKAFISAGHSTVRLSYGRRQKQFQRQCVFMGSTNEKEYLLDHTGNRRWWPILVQCKEIDTELLEKNIQQIWFEVLEIYRAMRVQTPRHLGFLRLDLLDPDSIALSNELQEDRRQQTDTDVQAGMIQAWLDTPIPAEVFDEAVPDSWHMTTCVGQLWRDALGNSKLPDRAQAVSVGKALRKIGWVADRLPKRLPTWGLAKTFSRPEGDLDRVKRQWAESDLDDLI